VAIYVKDIIRSEIVEVPGEFKHVEVVCTDVSFSNVTYRIICLYRKPGFNDTDLLNINDCVRCLKKLCSTDKLTVIAGDCNLPDIDWSYYSAPNTPIYTAFLDFVNSYGFHQYINEPTRQLKLHDS